MRERIKHVYGFYLLGTALKKSALVQTSKNTIAPHTCDTMFHLIDICCANHDSRILRS